MSSLSSHHLFDDGFHYIIQTAGRGEGEAERRVRERGKGGREIEDGEIERVKEGVWVRREGQKMDRMEGDRKREKKERGRGDERTREQRRRRPLRRLYQLLLANTHTQTHETHKPNTHTNIYKHKYTLPPALEVPYLLQPKCVILCGARQDLQLSLVPGGPWLATTPLRLAWSWVRGWGRVPLEGVGDPEVLEGRAEVDLGQQEGVAAGAVLHTMWAPL